MYHDIDPKTRFAVIYQQVTKRPKTIARYADIPLSTCYDWIAKTEAGKDIFIIEEGRGAKPTIDREDIDAMIEEADQATRATSTRRLGSKYSMSNASVHRILVDEEFKFQRRRKSQALLQRHKDARIQFSEEYLEDLDTFSNCFFVDEAGFTLGDMQTKKVWARGPVPPIERDWNRVEEKVSIWGGISERGATRLEIYDYTLGHAEYLKILKKHQSDMDNLYEEGYHFFQDQLPAHNEQSVRDWIRSNTNGLVFFPARSSDFNPIENVWAWLKEEVRRDCPEDIEELKKSIRHHWRKVNNIDFLAPYINSMASRLEECIELEGNYTHY